MERPWTILLLIVYPGYAMLINCFRFQKSHLFALNKFQAQTSCEIWHSDDLVGTYVEQQVLCCQGTFPNGATTSCLRYLLTLWETLWQALHSMVIASKTASSQQEAAHHQTNSKPSREKSGDFKKRHYFSTGLWALVTHLRFPKVTAWNIRTSI